MRPRTGGHVRYTPLVRMISREPMYPLIDTHCHLDTYTDDEVAEVLTRAREVGVRLIVNAGTTLESSRRCVELTRAFPELYAGVGIHPMDLTGPVDEGVYAQLLECATSSDKMIVMSEIGLDFLDNMPDRAMQYQAFREQIRLARDLRLPIVFHSREAHVEVLRVLRRGARLRGRWRNALLPGRHGYGAGGHRLGVLHLTGEAAAPPPAPAGRRRRAAAGTHRAGDRLRPSTLQGEARELDRAASPP